MSYGRIDLDDRKIYLVNVFFVSRYHLGLSDFGTSTRQTDTPRRVSNTTQD